jgi:hypothetical protein
VHERGFARCVFAHEKGDGRGKFEERRVVKHGQVKGIAVFYREFFPEQDYSFQVHRYSSGGARAVLKGGGVSSNIF